MTRQSLTYITKTPTHHPTIQHPTMATLTTPDNHVEQEEEPPLIFTPLPTAPKIPSTEDLATLISSVRMQYQDICGWCLGSRMGSGQLPQHVNPEGQGYIDRCRGMSMRCHRCCGCEPRLQSSAPTIILILTAPLIPRGSPH